MDRFLEPSDGNRVRVFLPRLEEDGEGKVDQTVPVIVNGETTLILRGENVEVPYRVFEALYASGRFPRL